MVKIHQQSPQSTGYKLIPVQNQKLYYTAFSQIHFLVKIQETLCDTVNRCENIYIYIERERDRERGIEREGEKEERVQYRGELATNFR